MTMVITMVRTMKILKLSQYARFQADNDDNNNNDDKMTIMMTK